MNQSVFVAESSVAHGTILLPYALLISTSYLIENENTTLALHGTSRIPGGDSSGSPTPV